MKFLKFFNFFKNMDSTVIVTSSKNLQDFAFKVFIIAAAIIFVWTGIVAVNHFFKPSKSVAVAAQNSENSNNVVVNYPPQIPDTVIFAGDVIPTHLFDVYESLDNEILAFTFWHSNMYRYFKRANRYFPIIEPILEKNNIPNDFKYLALAESGLTNAASPAGAKGYWQFMEATAKSFKLEVNSAVDERMNLEKSTQAACEYLLNSYNKYKDWALVAASYNYGQGNVDKQLQQQATDNYYDLMLNSETARYYFRLIALKIVMENPINYGFGFSSSDLYPTIPTEELIVDTTINNLVQFAADHNTNLKILKELNPWLRENNLPNASRKEYKILIPKAGCRELETIWELQ